jgi:hypothetical protein
MRSITIAAAVSVCALVLPASASADPSPQRNAATCGGHAHGLHSPKGTHKLARRGWDADRVRKREGKIKMVRHRARCSRDERHVRKHIRKARHRYKRARRQQEQARALTPYGCGSAGDWAIPCSIVACESGYSWSAYNSSGAVGPYQLLGKGAPWPVDSESDKLTHHRIASDLWAGGAGRSHWVC